MPPLFMYDREIVGFVKLLPDDGFTPQEAVKVNRFSYMLEDLSSIRFNVRATDPKLEIYIDGRKIDCYAMPKQDQEVDQVDGRNFRF